METSVTWPRKKMAARDMDTVMIPITKGSPAATTPPNTRNKAASTRGRLTASARRRSLSEAALRLEKMGTAPVAQTLSPGSDPPGTLIFSLSWGKRSMASSTSMSSEIMAKVVCPSSETILEPAEL